MARDDLHFRLRIPEDLKIRIEHAAELNGRSMTAEIVGRLLWTFGPADEEMQALLGERDAAIKERDALAYRLDLAMQELASARKQLLDESAKSELVRASASKSSAELLAEKAKSEAYRTVIEIMSNHFQEWADGARLDVKELDAKLDAVIANSLASRG